MKWNDLTMKERSDLMSLFLQHGIGSLSDMRRIYDGLHDNPEDDNWLVRARKNVTDFLGITDHYTDYKRNNKIADAVIREHELANDPPGPAHRLPDGTISYGEEPLINEDGIIAATVIPALGTGETLLNIGRGIITGNPSYALVSAASEFLPDIASKTAVGAGARNVLRQIPQNIEVKPKVPSRKTQSLQASNAKPVIVLNEHTASADREFLKDFNRKFNRKYGYEAIPLDISKTPGKAEEAVKERLQLHNTFVRGVSDFESKDSRLTYYEKEFSRNRMRTVGMDPNNPEDRILYSFIFPAPNFKYYGRADIPEKLYSRVSNSGPYLENGTLGSIYTSNSLGTGSGYTYGQNLHNVGVVRRPYILGKDRNKWYLEGDFEAVSSLGKGNRFVQKENIDRYLRQNFGTGFDDFIQEYISKHKIENEFPDFATPITDIQREDIKNWQKLISEKNKSFILPEANTYLDFMRNKLLTQDILSNPQYLRNGNYRQKAIQFINKKAKDKMVLNTKRLIKEAKQELLSKVPDDLIITNKLMFNVDNKYTPAIIPQPKHITKSKDAYTHMIFSGEINDTPLLNYIGRVDEFPEFIDKNNMGPITRQHYGNSWKMASRKTRKNGGFIS